MEGQYSIFDYSFEDSTPKEMSNYKIKNKVRLIELFAGVGSQAMAMKRLGEHLTYVWGMDANEQNRADRLVKSQPEYTHEFPLIDRHIDKQEAHAILDRLGIARPKMYDLGFLNNNCVGCVKGGQWYWNQIRKRFPDVFKARAELEREVGHSCLNGMFLDELPLDAGRKNDEISQDCGVMCYLTLNELNE